MVAITAFTPWLMRLIITSHVAKSQGKSKTFAVAGIFSNDNIVIYAKVNMPLGQMSLGRMSGHQWKAPVTKCSFISFLFVANITKITFAPA